MIPATRQVGAAALLLFSALLRLDGAEPGQLDASSSLFTIWAALDAAEVLPPSSPSPLRNLVRRELAARPAPSVLKDIRRFVERRRKPETLADLGPYFSFALCVDGPPQFKFRYRGVDLPPDVAAMEGLAGLLKRFHEQADVDSIWRKAQPVIEREIEKYHEPVTQAVLEVNAYLRNVTSGFLGRRFQVYVDPLGPPNQVHTRSFGDDFFVVLTYSAEPKTLDVRHAYLHYLLDPTVVKYGAEVEKVKGLGDFAQAAPALAAQYKEDFSLLLTECLIKAVESRLARRGRQELVDQALAEGFILTPFFAEQLAVYEKQEVAMRLYFPDMIAAIDLAKEDKRLEGVQFASAPAQRPVRKEAAPPEPAGVEKTLEEAEQLYTEKRFEAAREAFSRALRETEVLPMHAKAYYGLARIALQERNPELAEKLLQKTLELDPEPFVKAWAHVYLGRLADAAGEREPATEQYRAALAVPGASSAARQAAEKGLQQRFGK